MKYLSGIFALLLVSSCGCGKNSGTPPPAVAPSNLVVTAVVSTDNSGTVAFTATADNAVTYDYDFGDGTIKTVPTGKIDYIYNVTGNNTFYVTVNAKSASGQLISKSIQVAVNITPTLVWSDEFNVNGAPDPQKWNYETGTGSNGWGNGEAQYYTSRPENVIVQDGKLKITAKKENYNGSAYTSARLLTRDKFAFRYGKVVVSAKLPTGAGTWPAIWMLGSDVGTAGWPACGEVDIMEHKGSTLNKIYATLHYPGHSGGNGDGSTVTIQGVAESFHEYVVDWRQDKIRFYVDNQLFFTFANNNNVPFNHDFFLLINFAMGGGFGGTIDPAFTSAVFEVDYVRVYK